MKRHLSDVEIEAYRSGSVSPEQLLAFNDHLFECDQCFRLCDSAEKVIRASEGLRKILDSKAPWREHLNYEQLAGFVDGTSNAEDTRFVLAHIQECEECRSDLKELTKLRDRNRVEAGGQPVPAKPARLAVMWKMPRYRWAFGLAVSVVLLAGVFWMYSHIVRSRLAREESEIAGRKQGNTDLRQRTGEQAGDLAVSLKDGSRQIAIDKNGELQGLANLPATYRTALKDALKTSRLSIPPPPATTLGQVGTLLGADTTEKGFDVISPTATVVENANPRFEWQRLDRASEYTVMIKDLSSGAEIQSPTTSITTWVPGAELVRGHQYAWMVEAKVGARRVRAPAPDKPFATFKVLDEDQANQIEGVRKMYGDSHLVTGLAYAQAGIVQEAEQEFRALLAANPDSAFAKSLLESVAGKHAGGNR